MKETEINYFAPCYHCGYQMPPKEYKQPGDGLNQHCPKCLEKGDENGMCDIIKTRYVVTENTKDGKTQ